MKNEDSKNKFSKNNKWLIVVFACILFCAALLITDYCSEVIGPPPYLIEKIQKHLAKRGILFQSAELHLGIFKGVTLRNVSFFDRANQINFHANEVKMDFLPSKIFSGVFLPIEVEIEGGTFSFPLFPELGKEAVADLLTVTDLNARFIGSEGHMKVRYADGIINKIQFRTSGEIENLLHISLVHGLDFSKKYIRHKNKQPENFRKTFFTEFIQSIPLDLRTKIFLTLERAEKKGLNPPPFCKINFSLDLQNFKNTTADILFILPEFYYGNLKVGSLHQKIAVQNGKIQLGEMKVALGGNTFISLNGSYNSQTNSAQGKIHGITKPKDIFIFFDQQTRAQTAEKIKFDKGDIAFSGNVNKFYFDNSSLEGTLRFRVPSMTVDGIEMKNIITEMDIAGSRISGKLKKADLPGGGSLSGTFVLNGSEFSCELNGAARPDDILCVFAPEMTRFLNDQVKFDKKNPLILFSGKLYSKEWKNSQFRGDFKVKLENLNIAGMKINKTVADVSFTPDCISLENIEASMKDGARLKGNLAAYPQKKLMTAFITASGNPTKVLAIIKNNSGTFLREITKEIKWPDSNNMIGLSADIFADFGKNPFFTLTGSLILKDFAYRGIPFDYGAAKFHIGMEKAIQLPNVILKNKDGKLWITAVYKPRFTNNGHLAPGTLDFTLKSSIKGQELFTLIFPSWKSKYISFPYPLELTATGNLDYDDINASKYEADIQNGSCICLKSKVDDMDLKVNLQDGVLTFQNASYTFCGGRGTISYDYNFTSEKGNIQVELKNVDARNYSRGTPLEKILDSPKFKGTIDSKIDTKFAFDENDDVLLYGKGKFEMNGTNIWSIPVLTSFLSLSGKVWGLDNFCEITKIISDFSMKDDTLSAVMQSNGGLFALSSHGKVHWTPGDYDFTINVKFLKNLLPFEMVPRLLMPVSWIFSRRIKGNEEGFNWE